MGSDDNGVVDCQIVRADEGQTALAAVDEVAAPISFHEGMALMPVEQQQVVLAEYKLRRDCFRDWLRKQLQQGVHYGYPPGCEPREGVQNGVKGAFVKGKFVPASQWTFKPSFYDAGAAFLVDLLKFRCEYEADPVAWAQGGSKVGHYHTNCTIFSRTTGDKLGQGVGAYKVDNQHDDNAAKKMAKKCAKVDAVLEVLALKDLYTQDEGNDSPAPGTDLQAQKQALIVSVGEWRNGCESPLDDTAFIVAVIAKELETPKIRTIGEVEHLRKVILVDQIYTPETAEKIPES